MSGWETICFQSCIGATLKSLRRRVWVVDMFCVVFLILRIFHEHKIVSAAHCIVSPSMAPSHLIVPPVHEEQTVHHGVGVVKNVARSSGQSCRRTFVAWQLPYCWMCCLSRSTLAYTASLSVCDSWSTRCFFVGGGADTNISACQLRCWTSPGA